MRQQLFRLTYSLNDIDQSVKEVRELMYHFHLFAFSGEMGGGKTTFIHRLCDLLHVEDTVSSPTFALINEYHFAADSGEDKIIFHLDWYRLKDAAEAINAGMEDCVDAATLGEAFCFIEWPEKAIELLRPPYIWVRLETTDSDQRSMTVDLISD